MVSIPIANRVVHKPGRSASGRVFQAGNCPILKQGFKIKSEYQRDKAYLKGYYSCGGMKCYDYAHAVTPDSNTFGR